MSLDLTGAHYRQQLAIKAGAVGTAHRLWATWDGTTGTWARLLELATPLVTHQHTLSGQIARSYYTQMVAQALGKHEKALPLRDLPDDQIARSLTSHGLVGTYAAKARGASEQAARQIGFVKFAGSYSDLALSGSRDVLVSTVKASSLATGWERITSADPCPWCGDQADEVSTDDDFPAHGHCSCTAKPLFT